MKQKPLAHNGIPISISFDESFEQENTSRIPADKTRLLYISALAIAIGICISFIAKFLVYLINLITNLSFHHQFSFAASSPATNTYGLFVILVPAIGGLIVGLMALYGSKAIRGHGIPEAMEQILTNQSKITHYERKVLLAAGATAGMSAIFGSPIAAIFLAIELLLFEFSPRSILPVALACITGSAGHHLLFEGGYVFQMPNIAMPGNTALFFYSVV